LSVWQLTQFTNVIRWIVASPIIQDLVDPVRIHATVITGQVGFERLAFWKPCVVFIRLATVFPYEIKQAIEIAETNLGAM
jgi:hypothetical protein